MNESGMEYRNQRSKPADVSYCTENMISPVNQANGLPSSLKSLWKHIRRKCTDKCTMTTPLTHSPIDSGSS